MAPSTPRRILILNHNVREHGTYFRAWKVARVLARRGWKVTFVTTGHGWYRPRRGTRDGITVWETPCWSPLHHADEGWSPLGLKWRLAIAMWKRFDVVYSFSHRPVDQLPACLARRLRGALWVCDWCDLYGGEGLNAMARARRGKARTWRQRLRDSLDRVDERLENAAARRCDLLTVISSFLADRARELGTSGSRILHMVSGADLEQIRPLNKHDCRARLGLDPARIYLGYIANYHPDETLLLDALAIVARERPNVGVIAVGPEFYGGAQALAARGLAERVRHFGRVPFAEIATYLGAADILLVPMTDTPFNRSRWPNKIGDHLAAGRSQVASNVGDVRELMADGAVGIGAEPTPEAFARTIISLVDDPARCEAMGRAARQLAETQFDWERIVDRFIERIDALR